MLCTEINSQALKWIVKGNSKQRSFIVIDRLRIIVRSWSKRISNLGAGLCIKVRFILFRHS